MKVQMRTCPCEMRLSIKQTTFGLSVMRQLLNSRCE